MLNEFWIACMFINGGDYTKLSAKREYKLMMDGIKGIKTYLDSKKKSDILPMITSSRRMSEKQLFYIKEFFIMYDEKYKEAFKKPLIPFSSYLTYSFQVSGKHLEAAFTAMKREIPYKDFNHIMSDLIFDAQEGVATYGDFSNQGSITSYLIKKSYK